MVRGLRRRAAASKASSSAASLMFMLTCSLRDEKVQVDQVGRSQGSRGRSPRPSGARRTLCKQDVRGSNPLVSTSDTRVYVATASPRTAARRRAYFPPPGLTPVLSHFAECDLQPHFVDTSLPFFM